ncbi:MAG TPA: hypothetical protein VK203_22695 [Nostocaceae cyanobacterium]|nr:hypothetical protein [Nostocaceae cyanobacterium]
MTTQETLETLQGIRPLLMQLQPQVRTTEGRSLLARILASVDAVEVGINTLLVNNQSVPKEKQPTKRSPKKQIKAETIEVSSVGTDRG